MTKTEVAARISIKTGFTQKQSMEALELFLGCVREALMAGEKVCLVGFGSFFFRHRDAHKARNPRTGETVLVPAKKALYFKPGKRFRAAINGGTYSDDEDDD